MSRISAGLVLAVPFAVALSAGLALAGDGATTVVKTPPATGSITPQQTEPKQGPVTGPETATDPKDELRPAQDLPDEAVPAQPGSEAAVPSNEITPSTVDEGAGWDAAVEATPGPTPLIGPQQTEAVQRINAYFNSITNLQGSFDQVDANNKRTSGRFYVQRPGKIRFDYAPPSGLRIIADGSFLAIEDSDLKTVEKYPIESTPFRLLLADSVDLGRDAQIVGVESQEGTLAISLEDKKGEAAGSIKLFFEAGSELVLRQWLITDAQGLTTSVTINDVVEGRKVAADFFTSKENFQPFR